VTSLSVLSDLPPDFRVQRGRRGVLAVREDLVDGLSALGFGPDEGDARPSEELRGRRPLGEIEVLGKRYVVRRFTHGGLLRFLTGSRFSSPERPFKELVLSERLLEDGVATPRVVAVRARRGRLFWELELVTRRIERATELFDWLGKIALGEVAFELRTRLLCGVGRELGRLHRMGFAHADLHPRNLLVENAETDLRIWLLDLDKSTIEGGLSDEARRRNLRRLVRSIEKRAERLGPILSRADYARALRSYAEVLGPDTRWHDDWRAVARETRRFDFFHRIGWWFEALVDGKATAKKSPRA
jgi:3-deoxy-D-manno-octulosonic acid kinase